jgi:hypothetical protein BATR1942_00120
MNVKQTSNNNQNIHWGQPDMFGVFEPITDGEEQYLVCSKQKRIKITPLYKVHRTKDDEVFYKVELEKYKPLVIGEKDLGGYDAIHSETYNVSRAEMARFMNFLIETFALETVDVNTFVSVDYKGAVREILRKYQSDKTLFETLPMADLDTINGNVTLQNLKNIRDDMKENLDTGGEIEYWHPFLKKYNWILSQLFIAPYILFQDEFYVGGKRYDRKGEVRADFGVKNIRTGNCAIIEIKDAKQELVTSYRTGEYRISNALSGALSQVLKQKDTLYKEYWHNVADGSGYVAFSANNIKSILIIGTLPTDEEEIKTFDSFRNELKGIEIITFDELLEKIELQIQIMEGNVFTE